ncbi:MAG TPA: TlpA disulfide reductase family protein [Candidatus Saccharimonadia bacterium]|nr:TlpA disulfide reductase family protein [Candidatus Saccharimonadia bacterium]
MRDRLACCALMLGVLLAPGVRSDDQDAPAFTLPRLDGGEAFAFSSLAGRVVLVDFWASWCTPCRHSLPAYDALYESLAPRGFDVVAINLDESAEDARGFLAETPLSIVVVRDAAGDSARAWGVRGMPSSYLVGCDGTIRSRQAGFRKQELPALRAKIESLLKESACDAPAG